MDKLGVEMTFLRAGERAILMKGMILRRLRPGSPLKKAQLDVAIEQDLVELTKKFTQFDFETYVGCGLESFYDSMTAAMLINRRTVNGHELYESGPLFDDFNNTLSEDMEWFIDWLPMSTRGFFDQLKQEPDRGVTMNIDDLVSRENQIIEDQRKKKHSLKDHQLRAGPIIRP